jgi:hypothetical protein
MSDDLFNSNVNDSDPGDDAFSAPNIQFDETKDYVAELVGEDKKFKDITALAKGKAHSDAFIAHLLRETKELKEELNKRRTLEEFMTNIENRNGTQTPPVPQPTPQAQEQGLQSPLSLEDIKKQVREELEAKAREEKRNANLTEVTTKLRASYGEQASSIIVTRAKELGVSTKQLQDLAADAPAAFFRLVGEPTPAPQQNSAAGLFSPPPSAINTVPQAQINTGDARTMSFYKKLKAQDPKKYESSEVQVKMHKDAMKLGERFFDV